LYQPSSDAYSQVISDEFQPERLKMAVEGEDGEDSVKGLLQMVRRCQTSDSLRSYQCIKTLVQASNKSAEVKEYLLQAPDRWQWAVNWLKNKMNDDWANNDDRGGSYWSSTTSNEDASIRTFHRTTSAQVTLDEAKAILAEFDASLPANSSHMETNEGHHDEEEEDAEMPDLQEIRPKDY